MVVHSTSVVRMTVTVSKINRLKALVVPFFPLALLVFDEEVNMP
jgi:hypothetical protein